jgi:Pro-kumamolisin, activation domain/FG-GAP-like repeat/Subtilase family/FG-GAP repeat
MGRKLRLFGACAVVAVCGVSVVHAQASPGSATRTPLINSAKISNAQLTTLKGTVPLRISHSVDIGIMGQTEVIPSMTLLLKRTPAQEKQLQGYVASLSSPGSANYHKWLTAKQVGERFGPSDQDISTVKTWLASQGLGVKSVSADKMMIHFSGPVAAVGRAFGTTMHHYVENGKTHFANATEQKLPSELTTVVAGVASLSDFFPKSQAIEVGPVKRSSAGQWVGKDGPSSNFNSVYGGNTYFDVAPADFNAIYNVNPVWSQGVRGAGQTIAVLEDSDVLNQDVATFRQIFLPPDAQGVFSQINPASPIGAPSCTDPGTNPDEGEAALDAEWAGAAAPDANVVLASCADNGSEFGAFLAAENLLSSDSPPPIISLSYGECEMVSAQVGDAQEAQYLWNLAAFEGVTVFVSSGDSGSAGCDQDNSTGAQFGLQVSGLASTPYNVAVGGTDFNDAKNTSSYWASGNGNLGQSALGYVPEMTWNDSCASPMLDAALGYSDPITACNTDPGQGFVTVIGGSGGPSYLWIQPPWQTGVRGMPQTTTRALPDISLFAANGLFGHALLYCMSDTTWFITSQPCNYLNPQDVVFNSAGGTSFAAPAMAGVQALINQADNTNHGNIGPMLYQLARKEYGINGSPLNACGSDGSDPSCVFHDVTVGNNDEPCQVNTDNCYGIPNQNQTVSPGNIVFGVLSSSGSQSLAPAWTTGQGYDYATGLGSVNVANLVNAITTQDTRSLTIPRTWDLNGVNESGSSSNPNDLSASVTPLQAGDGHSTILMFPPASCLSSASCSNPLPVMAWMNGGTVVQISSPPFVFDPTSLSFVPPFVAGDEVKAVATDLFSGLLQGQPVQISDNPINNTLQLDVYSWGNVEFRFPYPAGWTLVGTGVVDSTNQSEAVWFNSATGQLGYWSFNCSGEQVFGRLKNVNCDRTIGNIVSVAKGYTPHLADLNGDGYIDIVWIGPNNDIYYWINDGQGNYTRTGGGTFPAGWALVGAGEIAGSGKTDLIWYNASTSQFGWWIMNGTSVVSLEIVNVTRGYTVASIEDFDGDGLADILWTNAQGDAYTWLGTGGHFISQHVADGLGNPYTIPAGYVVQKSSLQGVVAVPQGGGGSGSGGGGGGPNPPTLP